MLANRVRMSLLDVGANPEDIADENCQVATDADFSGDTNGSFKYIGTATRLVIPHVIKGVRVTSYTSMFTSGTVTEVRSNNSRVTNMESMFQANWDLTSLDLSNFDTSKVTNMNSTFRDTRNLISLDLSNFDTSNVTTMYGMFWSSINLISLDLSNFDTSNVTTMYGMFRYCRELSSLDVSSFDTSKVTTMFVMFQGCSGLSSLDLSSFNTTKVSNMSSIFNDCTSITTAYARTQVDADKFNSSSNKPSNVNFVVK